MQSWYLAMSKPAALALPLFCVLIANAQSVSMPRRVPVPGRTPACSPGGICFSGKVSEGEEFRKTLTAELEFVLEPGWNITIVPTRPEGECKELAAVVNPPYRAHREIYIDMSYGMTAEHEVAMSPREFRFVMNCNDYRTESGRLSIVLGAIKATRQKYDEALATLGTSARGKGRLWITDSKIRPSGDTPGEDPGSIEWMKFSVEILLPNK